MLEFEEILRDDLVKFWREDLDERETDGKNRSPMIDSVNRRVQVPLGSPYCIAGLLVRGVERLCTTHRLTNPVVMTGGTQFFWNKAPIVIKGLNRRARRGDIGIMQSIANPIQGHAFGFTEDELNGIFKTIEYNTNEAGSRDGIGVFERVRRRDMSGSMKYRGTVDVVAWILTANR
jgi:hypothetical protein